MRRTIAERNALVEAYIPLASKVANDIHRRTKTAVEREELVSEAMLILVMAAKNFREKYGVPFATFVIYRVLGGCIDYIRKQKRTRMPDRPKFIPLQYVAEAVDREIPSDERDILEICEGMDERDVEFMVYKYSYGFQSKEIAAIVGRPLARIYKQHKRILGTIKNQTIRESLREAVRQSRKRRKRDRHHLSARYLHNRQRVSDLDRTT